MGSIGIGEILVIVAVVLVLFGPKKLPELGRSIGKALGEFRRGLKEGAEEKDDSTRPPKA